MNPLGGESVILAVFGACTAVVMLLAVMLRARRHSIAWTVVAGATAGSLIYGIIALLALAAGGTHGYRVLTWLVVVGAGAIPAGAIGLVEGLISSLTVRQFARYTAGSEDPATGD